MVRTERRDNVTNHIATRKKLVDITDIHTFKDLLDSVILTAEEREIIELHYIQGKTFTQIAPILGYAEVTICKKHQKILRKVSKRLT